MPAVTFNPIQDRIPRFSGTTNPASGKVLVAMDIDDTLVPVKDPALRKGTQETIDLLHKIRPQVEVMLNTARNLDIMPLLLPTLDDLPVDFMSVNMAQSLFSNPKKLPFKDWLTSLTQADEDIPWKDELRRRFGWDSDAFKEIVLKVYTAAGFTPEQATGVWHQRGFSHFTYPDGSKYLLDLRPLHSSTYRTVVKMDTPTSTVQGSLADTLSDKVQDQLKQDLGVATRKTKYPPRIDHSDYQPGSATVFTHRIQPQGIHKGIILDYVAQNLTQADHVITGGDHGDDDFEMMQAPHYTRADGKPLENYPIQVGDSPTLTSKMGTHPRFLKVKLGAFKDGLVQQLQKLGIRV